MVVHHPDRLVEAPGAHHRQHRPEDLVLVDLHVGAHMVEQAAAHEVALLVALQLQATAVDHEFGAFLHALVDIAHHLVPVLARHQRTHLRLRIEARPDLQRRHARRQLLHQPVADIAHRDGNRDRHAALACRAIARTDQRIGHLVEVGVGHDHHVVLGAAQRLHALIHARARVIDVLADRRGAHERDRRHVGMMQQGVDRHLVAVQHLEDAGRQARLGEQLGQQHRRGGILLRRLQDEGIAAGHGHGAHAARDHDREVERRDARHHAQRLADRPRIHVGGDLFGEVALHVVGDAAGEFHDLQAAPDLALGIVEGLAVLQRHQARQIVEALFHQALEIEHHALAPERRRRRPRDLRLPGELDRVVDLGCGGERHHRRHLAGRRVGDVALPAARARDPLVADVVPDSACHDFPRSLSRSSTAPRHFPGR